MFNSASTSTIIFSKALHRLLLKVTPLLFTSNFLSLSPLPTSISVDMFHCEGIFSLSHIILNNFLMTLISLCPLYFKNAFLSLSAPGNSLFLRQLLENLISTFSIFSLKAYCSS